MSSEAGSENIIELGNSQPTPTSPPATMPTTSPPATMPTTSPPAPPTTNDSQQVETEAATETPPSRIVKIDSIPENLDAVISGSATAAAHASPLMKDDDEDSKLSDKDAEAFLATLPPSSVANRESAIQALLTICAEQNVTIPSNIKSIIGTKENQPSSARNSRMTRTSMLDQMSGNQTPINELEITREVRRVMQRISKKDESYELKIRDGAYHVTNHFFHVGDDNAGPQIPTVLSGGVVSKMVQRLKLLIREGKLDSGFKSETKAVMEGINLHFESGKMYLVLGAPGCGKSTLLKMIAKNLVISPDNVFSGDVTVNNTSQSNPSIIWQNLVAYIDQIDRLHALLTVQETCDFAWQCRMGGTHAKLGLTSPDDPSVKSQIEQLDRENWFVDMVLRTMGIARVRDTFVGDTMKIRGVSGGERKRVTVSEMLSVATPIMCLDEISTGLDSATTFDVINLLRECAGVTNSINIVSLLQPPPETVALFDEIILLDKGKVVYAGSVRGVVGYFNDLGYELPDRMDTTDWLQRIPTKDGAAFLRQGDNKKHMTSEEFVEAYENSKEGKVMMRSISASTTGSDDDLYADIEKDDSYTREYANSWWRSVNLVAKREITLWLRDRFLFRSRIVMNVFMGVVVGTLFYQKDDPQTLSGIFFQSLMYTSLAVIPKTLPCFTQRPIFYKHNEAKFFPSSAFVIGRALAMLPSAMMDGFIYGSIVYWLVGLAHDDGASIANYFIYVLVLVFVGYGMSSAVNLIVAVSSDIGKLQGMAALNLSVSIIFSGYVVLPDVIPDYLTWLYWPNSLAWAYRALMVNEFQSGRWDHTIYESKGDTTNHIMPSSLLPDVALNERELLLADDNKLPTEGELVLERFGLTIDGEALEFVWVWYSFLYLVGFSTFMFFLTSIALNKYRYATGQAANHVEEKEEDDSTDEEGGALLSTNDAIDLPFEKVNMTFKDIHYYVQASTTDDELELLKGVSGFIEAGKMTALMGASGAGKTTLMDVLSLRKNTGRVEGEVTLNGHPQSPIPFRRCTGYVEQFDTQTAELTIRETVEFSAKMRLDIASTDPETTEKFINQTLNMLELTSIQDLIVGSDATGGLSFEQKKRLSIAVELVANPSIIFLDEPTSGLDARAASIVMRGLKRIALSGRAICATIHQPSQAIFNDFDSLLLLRRGGSVVFFGDLGHESDYLIQYLEGFDETDEILPGENPATWMLLVTGTGSRSTGDFDYARAYEGSVLHKQCQTKMERFKSERTEENRIEYEKKFARGRVKQNKYLLRRMFTIYWRSPSYNRFRFVIAIMFSILLGSLYASQQTPENEADMNSRVASIFISVSMMSTTSMNMVLPVFENIRNLYYRHKASLMYRELSLVIATTIVELPFVILSSLTFSSIFYFMAGFAVDGEKFLEYWQIVLLSMMAWAFFGQALLSITPNAESAQGLGSVFSIFSNLLAGVMIRPQEINDFWKIMYYAIPGHYSVEGLVTSQYHDDDTMIDASPGSPFSKYLNGTSTCPNYLNPRLPCQGTTAEWIHSSFDDEFSYDHYKWDLLYLVAVCVLCKVISVIGLGKLNFLSK